MDAIVSPIRANSLARVSPNVSSSVVISFNNPKYSANFSLSKPLASSIAKTSFSRFICSSPNNSYFPISSQDISYVCNSFVAFSNGAKSISNISSSIGNLNSIPCPARSDISFMLLYSSLIFAVSITATCSLNSLIHARISFGVLSSKSSNSSALAYVTQSLPIFIASIPSRSVKLFFNSVFLAVSSVIEFPDASNILVCFSNDFRLIPNASNVALLNLKVFKPASFNEALYAFKLSSSIVNLSKPTSSTIVPTPNAFIASVASSAAFVASFADVCTSKNPADTL